MIIGRIEGTTRVIGESQGYEPLPLRDQLMTYECANGHQHTCPTMTTAWYPTPAELKALLDGSPVHVRLIGVAHPPIYVAVPEAAEENFNGKEANETDGAQEGRQREAGS